MDFGLPHLGVGGERLANSIDLDTPASPDDDEMVESSAGEGFHLGRDDKVTQSSSGLDSSVVQGDINVEPYVGMEFESEAAAHIFYSAYGMRVGFITRVSKASRSKRDKSIIGRALVCNKEGFRLPDKRDQRITQPRAPTRVGCKAMIGIKKLSSGRWTITRFVKDHNHVLVIPEKYRKGKGLIYDMYPNEHERIWELSQQLLLEKKRCAAYKRHLDLVFEHIEEHNRNLTKNIKYIVDSVKEIESEEQEKVVSQ